MEKQEETQEEKQETQFTYSANADSAQPVQLNTTHYLKKLAINSVIGNWDGWVFFC